MTRTHAKIHPVRAASWPIGLWAAAGVVGGPAGALLAIAAAVAAATTVVLQMDRLGTALVVATASWARVFDSVADLVASRREMGHRIHNRCRRRPPTSARGRPQPRPGRRRTRSG